MTFKETLALKFLKYVPEAEHTRAYNVLMMALPSKNAFIQRKAFEKFATLFGPFDQMIEKCHNNLFASEEELVWQPNDSAWHTSLSWSSCLVP